MSRPKRTVARSPGDALFQAILDEPDADAHRLVYADWLEEHGQPERAEFIRVQCALATMAGDDPRLIAMTRREGELLAQHYAAWIADLPRWAQRAARYGTPFHRGFFENLRCTTVEFVNGLGGLLRHNPVQHAELLRIKPGYLDRAAAVPGLARLRGLLLSGSSAEELIRLVESPHLTELTRIDLYWGRLTMRQLLRLLKRPPFARLTRLGLCLMDDSKRLADLVASPIFPQLTSLLYHDSQLTPEDLRAFAESPNLARLTSLSLHSVLTSPPGLLPILAESRHLKNLTSLTFTSPGHTPEDIESLANSPHLRNLTDLALGWTAVPTPLWGKLLRSPRLPRLTRFQVYGNDDLQKEYGLVPVQQYWFCVPRG